ncbi:hypothetical protein ADK38_13215, partial [Streptomyces varsoviensis]
QPYEYGPPAVPGRSAGVRLRTGYGQLRAAYATKAAHAVGESANWGPCLFLESRTWTVLGQVATSTQSPSLPLLWLDFCQEAATSMQSPLPLLL